MIFGFVKMPVNSKSQADKNQQNAEIANETVRSEVKASSLEVATVDGRGAGFWQQIVNSFNFYKDVVYVVFGYIYDLIKTKKKKKKDKNKKQENQKQE